MDLVLGIDPGAAEPLHRQVYGSLRAAILEGRLGPGARLPSSRALAATLGLARNTVTGAYEQLLAEGYLETRHGSGTYVAPALPDEESRVKSRETGVDGTSASRPRLSTLDSQLSAWGRRVREIPPTPYTSVAARVPYDFRHGRPDAGHFPLAEWRRVASRQLRTLSQDELWYGPPAGLPRLQSAVAAYLARARGVRCTPEQVIVTTGTQQAIDLVARLTIDPHDVVAAEDPCYTGARRIFMAAGARILDVPVDEQGLQVAALPDGPVRLVYTTPSHQYPTGATLPVSRRLELLAWARQRGALVLEDDYDSEFRHAGRPLEAMQGLDRTDRVAYLGSFSKVLYPALRMGYLVVPPPLVGVATEAKRVADLHTATPGQEALAEFILEGHFEAHLRRMRRVYRSRRAALLEALDRELGDRAELGPTDAGLFMLIRLAPGLDEREVAQRATTLGVAVYPAEPYYSKRVDRPGLVLGYAALDEQQIAEGIRRLGRSVK